MIFIISQTWMLERFGQLSKNRLRLTLLSSLTELVLLVLMMLVVVVMVVLVMMMVMVMVKLMVAPSITGFFLT